jgi:hypothetical protein
MRKLIDYTVGPIKPHFDKVGHAQAGFNIFVRL